MSARHLGVTTWTLPERGIAGLAWARNAGFDFVHIDGRDVQAEGVDEVRAAADELGIGLAGVSAVELEAIGISGRESLMAVSVAIDLCIRLGIGYLYLPSFEMATIVGDSDLLLSARLLRFALRLARPLGISVATENTLDVDRLPRLFEEVRHPDLELLFDTQNPAMRLQSAPDIARLMAPRIRSFVHVKDGSTALGDRRVGAGSARVEESVHVLLAAGFVGSYVLESDYRNGDASLARDDQSQLREMVGRA